MDPISQGAVGAALAASVWRARSRGAAAAREHRAVPLRLAATLGALAAMAPDLDVLIRSANDPLLALEYHRQFTHALAFVPIGALLCSLLAYPLVQRWATFAQAYLFCVLGFASHGLLDACTSYGTRLLWPFSELRVAWNLVAVVDPAFTLPLVALVVVAVLRRRPGYALLALLWALTYLGAGAVQRERAEQAGLAIAEARGHQPERLLAKPSFGNLLVWKVVYQADGRYFVDAVRPAWEVSWFPGTDAAVLEVTERLPWLDPDSRQAADLDRFRQFSGGWLAESDELPNAVIDVRYSMIPNEIDPLWGIMLDPAQPQAPAVFFTDRRSDRRDRQTLLAMIAGPGRPLPDQPLRSAQSQPGWLQPSPSRQPSLQ